MTFRRTPGASPARWLVATVAALAWGASAVDAAAAPEATRRPGSAAAPPETTRRLGPAGTPSTAALPWVRLGDDGRFVLDAHVEIPLVERRPVQLPPDARWTTGAAVPAALAARGDVVLDAVLTARPPADDARTLPDLREGGRTTVTASSAVLPRAVDGLAPAASVVLDVPPELRGRPALVSLVAHLLPPPGPRRHAVAGVRVPGGARLRFGYGVEPIGWRPDAHPLAVRVHARDDAGHEVPLFERRLDPAADARDRGWLEASVDLAPVAGRTVQLQFETAPVGDPSGRSFGVVSSPVLDRPRAAGTPRNLVLISLDTLRARSVSAYGAPRATTPALDRRLAAAGARVREAVVPVPFTPPSHMTMLTGLLPCVHGVADHRRTLAPERPTLAELLRAAGWSTAAFTEDAYLVAEAGFARGFDRWSENRSDESSAPGFGADTFGQAGAWLATAPEPFFLFVHTYQVHDPYTPPRGYAGILGPGPPVRHQAALDSYEAEVRYTDDLLAGFLDALDARGLAGPTVVVVTSDHGESFEDGRVPGHGIDLHDPSLLVPLVLRAPGLVRPGTVVAEQVGLVDLVPTLLELLGVAAPPLQGRSFARLLSGRGAPFVERPLVATRFRGAGAAPDPARAVRTRAHKLIDDPGVPGGLLYDLRADPDERHRLLDAPPALAASLRAVLDQEDAACRVFAEAHPATPAGLARSMHAPGWLVNRDELDAAAGLVLPTADDAVARKLRSLGYVP